MKSKTDESRGWKRIEVSRSKQEAESGDWVAQVIGHRSDGEDFPVDIRLKGDWPANAETMSLVLTQALGLLEEYRTCGCVGGVRCEDHER